MSRGFSLALNALVDVDSSATLSTLKDGRCSDELLSFSALAALEVHIVFSPAVGTPTRVLGHPQRRVPQ